VAFLDAVVPVGSAWRELGAIVEVLAGYRRTFSDRIGDAAALPPARPGPTWDNQPVVLVHGIGHNPSAWINLAERLDAAGFVDVHAVSYGLGADVPAIATSIDRTVSNVLRSSGESRVHVVAHSLGGVAARYWHDVLGGRHRADAIVTLGAPHGGTPWAHLGVMLRNARAIVPGSSMLVEQDHYARWTTIGGSLDLVVPGSRAHLRTSRRIDLPGVGHAGLLTSPVVGGLVCAALLEAEHQRATGCEPAMDDDAARASRSVSFASG
jgi:hypothetical protein